jgi:hypothetical protein
LGARAGHSPRRPLVDGSGSLASLSQYHDESFREARELLERARSEARGNERLHVMIELRLTFTRFNLGLAPAAAGSARSALARAEQLDDRAPLAQALATTVMVDFCLGLGLDDEKLRRAVELGDPDQAMGAELQPSLIACFLYLWTSRFEESRAVLMAGCARWHNRGAEHWLAWAQHPRVWLECWRGDLASATTAMHESVDGCSSWRRRSVGRSRSRTARKSPPMPDAPRRPTSTPRERSRCLRTPAGPTPRSGRLRRSASSRCRSVTMRPRPPGSRRPLPWPP